MNNITEFSIYNPRWCNCWFWAQRMYHYYGGYVAKRQSTFSRIINHYLWSPDLKNWWYYAALSRKHRGWWFEAIWFRGEVRKGR